MKEKWNLLSDQEKTEIAREFFKSCSFDNFDYAKEKEYAERIKGHTPIHESPCLTLELVDPVMTYAIMRWMYYKPEGCSFTFPLMGYELKEFTFDKSTLMQYSEDEKAIMNRAIEILKNKGL